MEAYGGLLPYQEPYIEYSPERFQHLESTVTGFLRHPEENSLTDIDLARGLVRTSLESVDATRMLTLLTDLIKFNGDSRTTKMAYNARYLAAQLTSNYFDQIQELSCDEDPIVAANALDLILHSITIFPQIEEVSKERAYVIGQLPDAIESAEAGGDEQVKSVMQLYKDVLDNLLRFANDEEVDNLSNMIFEMCDDDKTWKLGAALRSTLIDFVMDGIPQNRVEETRVKFYAEPSKIAFMIKAKKLAAQAQRKAFCDRCTPQEMTDKLDIMYQEAKTLDSDTDTGSLDDFRQCIYLLCSGVPYCTYEKAVHYWALKYSGLDTSQLEDAWDAGCDDERPRYGRWNVNTISRLEVQRPGAAKELMDKFGIRNFARFPVEVLVDQFDNRDDADTPYGVMVMSTADKRGAFKSDTKRALVKQIADQSKAIGQHFRIFEFNGNVELSRIPFKLHWRYKKPISYLAWVNHSSFDNFRTGAGIGQDNYLYQHQVQELCDADKFKTYRQWIGSLFTARATGALDACTAGDDGAIGQTLCNLLGIPFNAPSKPTALIEVNMEDNSEGVSLSATYSDPVKREIHPKRSGSRWILRTSG
jgi:hypothetical protein